MRGRTEITLCTLAAHEEESVDITVSTKENAKWKLSSNVYLWPSSVYSALFV
jgi:hypothetical protein